MKLLEVGRLIRGQQYTELVAESEREVYTELVGEIEREVYTELVAEIETIIIIVNSK